MSKQNITIAVDAMGGDSAPEQNVRGALLAAADKKLQIILVGDAEAIKPYLSDQPDNVLIRHAPDVIGMHEPPVQAVRKKTQSSLVVAANLVKVGQADALLSAGNTGASAAAGLLVLGRASTVDRPAIATLFPTRKGFSLLLDVGANADCKPENLLEFAKMGTVYMEQMLGITAPTIGLLNIGEESSKGNFLALRAYELLQQSSLKFYGNVEGRDLPEGRTDIIISDGFTGNIALKLMEGISSAIFEEIKGIVNRSLSARLGAALLFSRFKELRAKLNPESYGGSPLLGVKGVVIIAHGSSSPHALANAVKTAAQTVENQLVQKIEHSLGL
ncbi:MAG: phosphate acyltransferase PlsX [Actinomycetota bacterium]|nr:phosphate acyltransferase PlsX [Actinomycetota bacterium]